MRVTNGMALVGLVVICGCQGINQRGAARTAAGQAPESASPPAAVAPSDRNQDAARMVNDYIQSDLVAERPRDIPRAATPPSTAAVLPMGAVSLDDRRPGSRGWPDRQQGQVPTLEWVSATPVTAAPIAPPTAAPAAYRTTAANTATRMPSASQVAPSRITQLEAAVAGNPNDIDAQLQLRYLYMAEGQHDKALAPPRGMDSASAQRLLTLLQAMRDGEQVLREGSVAPENLQGINAFQELVASRTALEIPQVALCSSIQSFGRFDAIPPDFFVAGGANRAYLYCELRHFASDRVESGYQTRVAHRLELLDPSGTVVWRDPEMIEIIDHCRNRRTDFFFNRLWTLPDGLAAGTYVLNVIVEDRIKSETTEAKYRFDIVGTPGRAAPR